MLQGIKNIQGLKSVQGLKEVTPLKSVQEITKMDEVVGLYELTDEQVRVRTEHFGPNTLSVTTPRFIDLYIEQLLSPLVIFQVFTSVLCVV